MLIKSEEEISKKGSNGAVTNHLQSREKQVLADEAEVIYMMSSSDANENLADENIKDKREEDEDDGENEPCEDADCFINTNNNSSSDGTAQAL